MKPHALLSFLAALRVILSSHASDPWDVWHWRQPDLTANQLCGATWGGDRYVAVGEVGTALVSYDGQHWLTADTGSRASLRAVAFGGGKFLAVGDAGEILTSPDGFKWTRQWSGTFADLKAVVWGNGTWVSVGEQGVVLTSPDAELWSLRGWGGDDFLDVTWGDLGFLAVGGKLLSSPIWNGLPTTSLAATSVDGLHWATLRPVGESLVSLTSATYGAGRYVIATGDGSILSSSDLQRWQRSSPGSDAPVSCISYGPLGFTAALGDRYEVYYNLAHSTDGVTWANREISGVPLQSFSGIASGPRGVVLAGGLFPGRPAGLIHSPDLREWSSAWESHHLGAIGFAGDYFFASALYSLPDFPGSTFWRSREGVVWEVIPGAGVGSFRLPIYAGGQYLAPGIEGQIAFSVDAGTWPARAPPTPSPRLRTTTEVTSPWGMPARS